MNISENLNTSLIDSKGSLNKARCCCFYLFCCCFCFRGGQIHTKSFYIDKWRKYLAKESSFKKQFEDPFRILMNLWAHKNVINDLEMIRLNPNHLNLKNIRNDLEFYIPQLCTFLIFGEYEVVEEFLAFLCKACYASFYFAHRIIWFLKSIMNSQNSYNGRIKEILHLIQTIFKSDTEKNKDIIDKFYFANSKKYFDLMTERNSLFLYRNNVQTNELLSDQIDLFNIRNSARNLIDEYSEKHYEYVINKAKDENIEDFVFDKTISPHELFLSIFKNYQMITNDEESIGLEYFKQIDRNDLNLTSFLSNINFVDHLCNICEILRNSPLEDQYKVLQNELMKVNKILPSNVYVPFTSEAIRNYVIVHIPVSEAKIFRTKTRAPYMITVEIIRIDELIYYYENKNKPQDQKHDKNNNGKTNNKRSQSSKQKDIKNKVKKLNFFKESDISLSKPVIIKNLKGEEKKTRKSNEKVHMDINYDSEEEFKKIDQWVKKMVKEDNNFNIDQKPNQAPVREKEIHSEEEKKSSFIKTKKNSSNRDTLFKLSKDALTEEFGELPHPSNKNLSMDEKDNEIEIKFKDIEMSQIKPDKNNESDEKKEAKNKKKKQKSKKIYEEIGHSSVLETVNIVPEVEKKDLCFGEKIEHQRERLRKISPFGKFNTWKLFKVIIKNGEDLRQEQFATQLINEFNQIFQLEEVEVWLKPYEILSTGNNVGLIEVCSNAVSLDYLKKKSNIATLSQFFESYFGPVGNERYNNCLNNFIRSLAGYSLVCYFLQIKDRHNGNILIDDQGHLIHIDFGFMLSNAPGKGLQFEKAPFKLTKEFVDVIGGVKSENFSKFRKLLWKGFIAASKHYEKICILVEMMYCGHGHNLPCFEKGINAIEELKLRFIPRNNMKKHDYISHVDSLIELSIDNWRTKWYDRFQYYFQGIFY